MVYFSKQEKHTGEKKDTKKKRAGLIKKVYWDHFRWKCARPTLDRWEIKSTAEAEDSGKENPKMDEYTYAMARRALPRIIEIEVVAEQGYKRRSVEQEKELYIGIHSSDPELSQKCKDELVQTNMQVVVDFVKNFPYRFRTAEAVEDLLQEGFMELAAAVDLWDIEKGKFQTLVRNRLKKLYRAYWKESYIQPQTSMQQDAKIRAFDNRSRMEKGEVEDAAVVAKALGKAVRTIEKARARIEAQSGRLDSIDRIRELYPGKDLSFECGPEGGNPDGLSVELEREFPKLAREALKNKPDAKLVFDFMVMEKNYGLPNNTLADIIEENTGIRYTYQQIYRHKQTIAAILIHEKLIDRRYIKGGSVKWLDEEVQKLENAEKAQKNKYAFLWK